MILPGRTLHTRSIIQNLKSPTLQVQPCGVDLSLKRVLRFTSPGTVDFDNTNRQTASTVEIPFSEPSNPRNTNPNTAPTATATSTPKNPINNPESKTLHLASGTYLIEFNETVTVPLDVMGQIFVRSSLFRSGVAVHAGVMDAGYSGAVGALMQVSNEHGVRVSRDARLAQMVFHSLTERTEGYNGVYQGARGV
ncbi:deoxyuridine 5'-triphosphate nucleotidohydrolase [Aspergillus steynii IBT 23096]|uniref:Deoxyuridine 5'-triphosphate nucleotidohydrolase n=1 Tax=Aspergillus steynii IBT 23096 TaxID=1392250 RepID=A0A2I2FRK7_9EURO|nr:deoxyuridine 5'-triphosphate nucleotidohydrolase [Aspergillus steynii IBT 23096]PLB43263.1 deoxyuridine 5'-triphosphate nucleotidohydrolase [Aspergillus steynii IBT 23096]